MEKQRARSKSEKKIRMEKLQQSAMKLFSKNGYRGTTIEMITDDAGLSPAAFYLYFKSKIEMYRTLNSIGIDLLESMITTAFKDAPPDPSSRIRILAKTYLSFFEQHRELYDIMAVLHLGSTDFFSNRKMVELLENRTKELLSLTESIIKSAINEGIFKKIDPWKSSVALWGMLDGILIMEVKKSTGYTMTNVNELVDTMLNLVLKGIEK